MRYYILLIITLFLFSCGNEKVIQLPQVSHSEITEINDVSAAYLFYDETQKDSVELNRKNLISTTNWLLNIDKRLTLKQVIPHIKFLQEKKSNSSHKNKNAKNYFTCNDKSRKNLGFIEFTDVEYHEEPAGEYFTKTSNVPENVRLSIIYHSLKNIEIMGFTDYLISKKTNQSNLIFELKNLIDKDMKAEIVLNFNQILSFQDYISLKSMMSNLDLQNVVISNHEFIYN
tara:strand:+ start:1167 stop:1853 length:687 start_codon:yes stop_codon:yes gene_type:complete